MKVFSLVVEKKVKINEQSILPSQVIKNIFFAHYIGHVACEFVCLLKRAS